MKTEIEIGEYNYQQTLELMAKHEYLIKRTEGLSCTDFTCGINKIGEVEIKIHFSSEELKAKRFEAFLEGLESLSNVFKEAASESIKETIKEVAEELKAEEANEKKTAI